MAGERTPEGRFAPGVSGNPGGRPKGIAWLRDEIVRRELNREALDAIQLIVQSPEHRDHFEACKWVMAYHAGAAPKAAESEDDTPLPAGGLRVIFTPPPSAELSISTTAHQDSAASSKPSSETTERSSE